MDIFDAINKIRRDATALHNIATRFNEQYQAFNKPPLVRATYAAPMLVYLTKMIEWIEASMQEDRDRRKNQARNRWEQKYKVFRLKGDIVTLRFWLIDFITKTDAANSTNSAEIKLWNEAFDQKMLNDLPAIADKLVEIGDAGIIVDLMQSS